MMRAVAVCVLALLAGCANLGLEVRLARGSEGTGSIADRVLDSGGPLPPSRLDLAGVAISDHPDKYSWLRGDIGVQFERRQFGPGLDAHGFAGELGGAVVPTLLERGKWKLAAVLRGAGGLGVSRLVTGPAEASGTRWHALLEGGLEVTRGRFGLRATVGHRWEGHDWSSVGDELDAALSGAFAGCALLVRW